MKTNNHNWAIIHLKAQAEESAPNWQQRTIKCSCNAEKVMEWQRSGKIKAEERRCEGLCLVAFPVDKTAAALMMADTFGVKGHGDWQLAPGVCRSLRAWQPWRTGGEATCRRLAGCQHQRLSYWEVSVRTIIISTVVAATVVTVVVED